MVKLLAARMTAMAGALALAAGAPASAAATQAQPVAYSPWIALSAFASPSSSAALCGTSIAATASATATAQQGTAPGCVFPQVDAPPPVVTSGAVAPVAPVASSGIGTLPLLLGLATLVGLGALLLGEGDGNSTIVGRPLSPA